MQRPTLPDGADTQHLEWRGRQWLVVVGVPRDLRASLGKSSLRRPLHTHDLRVANRLKITAVASLRAEIAKARRALTDAPDDTVERFLADMGYQPKSANDARRVLRRLAEYGLATGLSTDVRTIDRATARGFLRDLVHRRGLSRGNAQKHLGFMRAYWRWLEEEGLISPDSWPWSSVSLPRAPAQSRHALTEEDGGKRPYTDDEIKVLVAGVPPKQSAYLADMRLLLALSGMRVEELYRLRVRDAHDGFFHLGVGKTKNAQRRVPIHTRIAGLVEGLRKDKAPEDYLFDPEARVVAQTALRSGAAVKAFSRFRVGLGLDERPNGKAKSNIDLHSLRRWFIKKAKDALAAGATGYSPWTIADVVGHDDEGVKDILKLTMGLYPGPAADAALKACVEAVILPS